MKGKGRAVTAALVASMTGLGTVLVDGTVPAAAAIGACGEPSIGVHDIQGNGAATPIPGLLVTVEAVVVGDYQGPDGLGGFYLAEPVDDIDADPFTSEGVFVATSATDVAPGDVVRVEGLPAEVDGETQLTGVTAMLVCSSGATVTPLPLEFPALGDISLYFEHFEGMAVRLTQQLTVTDVSNLGGAGEVELASGARLRQPTDEGAPGAPAQARQDANERRRIVLDDGSAVPHPGTVPYPVGGLSAATTLRVGATLPNLTAVLGFGAGRFRLQPVGPVAFVPANPRPAAPDPVGGELRAAGFDLGGYFNGDGAGGGFPTAGGATTPEELDRQRAKLVAAITALGADVVGLVGLENDDTAAGLAAVEDMVGAVNAATGAGTYGFVDTGVVGTGAVRVGILYRPGRVTPVGPPARIDHTVDPRFLDDLNRPSIAQTFRANADGARFTAVVNDFVARDADCGAGDPDTGDGQGTCNLTRTAAARALVAWLRTDPTHGGDSDVLLLGDLGSHAQEDPIVVLRDAGYVDTVDGLPAGQDYTSISQGQTGALDHALVSAGLAAQVTGVTAWHVNADEPSALDYNTELKSPGQVDSLYAPDAYRSSAHDPLLVGLRLDAPPGAVDAGGPYAVTEAGSTTVTATAVDPDGDPLSYDWDLDDNGTFETPGRTAVLAAGAWQAPSIRTIAVRAVDPGGHAVTDTASVDVDWRFRGFLSPIANLPKVNRVEPGAEVRIRFRLGGNQGLDVLAAGTPTYTRVGCHTKVPKAPAQDLSHRSELTYRAKTSSYVLLWDTSERRRRCGLVTVTLTDGTSHRALFRFVA